MRILSNVYNAWKRRREGAAFKEFRYLIATPTNLGTQAAGNTYTINMPGPGRLAIKGTVGWIAGKVTFGGATTGAVAANVVTRGRWARENRPVTIVTLAGMAAQTLTLYILDEWERPRAIATAVVT